MHISSFTSVPREILGKKMDRNTLVTKIQAPTCVLMVLTSKIMIEKLWSCYFLLTSEPSPVCSSEVVLYDI